MNVSSAIVHAADSQTRELAERLGNIEGCQVHLVEGHKLVLTIEAENISAETGIMKKVEDTPGVLSVKLVFAYSEEELEAEMKKINSAADYPGWLNEEKDARDIPYSGRLKL